jgi:hypothetical protein
MTDYIDPQYHEHSVEAYHAVLRHIIAILSQPVQTTADTDDVATLKSRVAVLRADCRSAIATARKVLP